MTRLYLRFYLAVLASITVLAVAAGVLWREFAEHSPRAVHVEMMIQGAENFLPAAEAPPEIQADALHRLNRRGRADLALFAADGRPIAQAGAPLPFPDLKRPEGNWLDGRRGPPAWSQALSDGRFLVIRPRPPRHPPGGGLLVTLGILAVAVAIGAYPVVRRLTRRLERLQGAVESLGRGDLRARVPVEGRDEIARLATSFNDAAARIEQLMTAHRLLLANASHELRTPLARVRMGIELLAGEAGQTANSGRKAALERDIAELDALIDEILLSSRLDTAPRLEATEALDLLALAAEETARYPDCAVSGQSVMIYGDNRLLRRLVRNLLENARRHGRPPVELSVWSHGRSAMLRVTDHGPGIPAGEQQAVFRPFHQVGGRKREGTGLGLALVKQIAELHGGDAVVDTTIGKGASVIITLPFVPPPGIAPNATIAC